MKDRAKYKFCKTYKYLVRTKNSKHLKEISMI